MTAITPPTGRIDVLRWPDLAPMRASARSHLESAVARALFHGAVRRLPVRVELADGAVWGAGEPGSPTMQIHRPAEFFRRVGADKLIGFGESYMSGDWDAEDLGGFLTELSRHVSTLVPEPLQKLRALVVARHPEAERGAEENTRDNIARHYDLSNDMFATFLDETMTYSAALFVDPPRTARSTTSRATVASAPDPGIPTRADLVRAQRR